ncbi:hypothetical protein TNCV_2642001 [Trichonephila clavipes]|nr:hypothetical protein TNCV_2642001 [Trichonephila clavipes]
MYGSTCADMQVEVMGECLSSIKHVVGGSWRNAAVRQVWLQISAAVRTVAAEQLLESKDIERMYWPARSPDLSPIEHACDFLGRRLAARTLPPVTIQELRLALKHEWAAMPQQVIGTLILSKRLYKQKIISPTKDRMFLLDIYYNVSAFSRIYPCYFFNQASFYSSNFSFSKCCLHYTCPYVLEILRY